MCGSDIMIKSAEADTSHIVFGDTLGDRKSRKDVAVIEAEADGGRREQAAILATLEALATKRGTTLYKDRAALITAAVTGQVDIAVYH